eukprot:3808219-Heterocapsa_arctica.AAC.1
MKVFRTSRHAWVTPTEPIKFDYTCSCGYVVVPSSWPSPSLFRRLVAVFADISIAASSSSRKPFHPKLGEKARNLLVPKTP